MPYGYLERTRQKEVAGNLPQQVGQSSQARPVHAGTKAGLDTLESTVPILQGNGTVGQGTERNLPID